jgi:hypothetical protein
MNEPYLEITYRRGRPVAAYLYLPRRARDRSHRASRVAPGIVVDFHRDGRPIGIEITAPGRVSLAGLNKVLRDLGQPPAKRADLAPLLAA